MSLFNIPSLYILNLFTHIQVSIHIYAYICTKKNNDNICFFLTIKEQRMTTTFLMSGALREHLPRHGDAGVVIAGVLQSAPTLHPLLPDNREY